MRIPRGRPCRCIRQRCRRRQRLRVGSTAWVRPGRTSVRRRTSPPAAGIRPSRSGRLPRLERRTRCRASGHRTRTLAHTQDRRARVAAGTCPKRPRRTDRRGSRSTRRQRRAGQASTGPHSIPQRPRCRRSIHRRSPLRRSIHRRSPLRRRSIHRRSPLRRPYRPQAFPPRRQCSSSRRTRRPASLQPSPPVPLACPKSSRLQGRAEGLTCLRVARPLHPIAREVVQCFTFTNGSRRVGRAGWHRAWRRDAVHRCIQRRTN